MRAIVLIAAIVAVTAVVVVDATSTAKLQRRLRSAVAHGAMVEEQVAVSAPHARVRLTNPLATANQFYGHGGFFGYGAELMDTPAWVKILSDLMPAVAKSVSGKTAVADIIKALENNPVVCAFGFEQSRLTNPNGGVYTQPFEWDSFFHPQATVEHPMVESMLVAHGTPLQLFQEGFWKSNSYGSVERTPSTELGGVTSVAWRDIFVKAVFTSRNQPIPGGKVTWPVFNALFPGGSYRVILDVKTGIHLATAKFLASVVTEFKKIGITVVGTGSFNYDQITGVVPAGGVPAPASTWFFHGLESRGLPLIAQPQFFDVYDASPNKLENKNVLFNLGFMLTYSDSILKTGADKQATYKLITRYVTKLRQIAASVPGLKIGGYVQEAAVDAAALNILFKFVKDEAATFKLGFAWGGRPDQWYSEPAPTRLSVTTGTDGQIIFAKVPEN